MTRTLLSEWSVVDTGRGGVILASLTRKLVVLPREAREALEGARTETALALAPPPMDTDDVAVAVAVAESLNDSLASTILDSGSGVLQSERESSMDIWVGG